MFSQASPLQIAIRHSPSTKPAVQGIVLFTQANVALRNPFCQLVESTFEVEKRETREDEGITYQQANFSSPEDITLSFCPGLNMAINITQSIS